MKSPKVSAILASYNHRNYVAEAVQSVLSQSFGDFELIVLDDGSTDGTPDVVTEFKDSRIQLVRFKENRAHHMRNIGLSRSKGEWVAFQNSDDVWLPEKLEVQVRRMEENADLAAVFTQVSIIDEFSNTITGTWADQLFSRESHDQVGWLRRFFEKGNCLLLPSALLRRSCLHSTGFFRPSLIQLSDYDLWIRLAAVGNLEVLGHNLTKMRIVRGHNLSRPTAGGFARSEIELANVLERFLEPNIFKQISEAYSTESKCSSEAAMKIYLAERARQLGRGGEIFSDRLVASVIDDDEMRAEAIAEIGTAFIHKFHKRRAEYPELRYLRRVIALGRKCQKHARKYWSFTQR